MTGITDTTEKKDGSFVADDDMQVSWFNANDLLIEGAYDDQVEEWIEGAPDGEVKMATFVELYDIAQIPYSDGDDITNYATVTSDLKTYIDKMRLKKSSGYHIMDGFHIGTCINFALLCLAILNYRLAWLGAMQDEVDEEDDPVG